MRTTSHGYHQTNKMELACWEGSPFMRDGLHMHTATMAMTMIVQSGSRIVHVTERTLNGRDIIQINV